MPLNLEVSIDDPKSVYTCGDRIKGTVHIASEEPVLVKDLLVQLLCTVSTRTKGLSHASSTRLNDCESISIPYCFVRRIVTQPKHISSESEELRFEFTLPSETKRNEVEPSWRPSPTFEHLADHALPPTWTEDKQMRGKAVHFIEVVMYAGKKYDGRRFTKTMDINFTPCRAVLNPDPRSVKLLRSVKSKIPKALVNTPGVLPRRKSIMELLTPEEKPNATFQVEILCPTVLYAGGPIPLSISISTERQQAVNQTRLSPNQYTPPDSPLSSPVDRAPLMFVEGVYVFLESQTDRRIRDGPESFAQEHVLWVPGMVPVCNVFDRPVAISQTQGQPTSLHPHYPELRIRPEVTPSFRSFSIRRKYVMKLQIRLVIGDQEHNVDVAAPVLVLPSICRNIAGAVRDTGDLMPGLRRRVSEETLPPYEEVDPSVSRMRLMGLEDPPPLLW